MTAITHFAATPLWDSARAMFERMRRAVGEAAALAERAWIGPKEKAEIRSWLNPLIAFVRRLVLIEAIALARAPAPHIAPCAPNPAAKRAARAPSYALPLWPKARRTGPRARQLGPPLLVGDIWRDQARAAAARHLRKVRFMHPPPAVQFARRMDALARILERPLRAACRLARRLRGFPKVALKLTRKLPRTRRYNEDAYREAGNRAFNDTFAWLHPNTS